MATFAFGPVPDEPLLLGKRRNVTSSNPSRATNPAARRPRNQCLCHRAGARRGGTATVGMLLLLPRLSERHPTPHRAPKNYAMNTLELTSDPLARSAQI